MSIFHPLEVVNLDSDTQLQMDDFLNYFLKYTLRVKMFFRTPVNELGRLKNHCATPTFKTNVQEASHIPTFQNPLEL